MTGSNCYVMGFTDRGEPYQPMEFTSRTAWTSYYGTPDNEAERYAYAAACEVLNQNGRLYFARLPYDNASFQKVACFKYRVVKDKVLSVDLGDDGKPTKDAETGALNATPFWEIVKADPTVDQVAAIEPDGDPYLQDLSAIDEWRTDESRVGNNTFVIADVSFNTYGKIPEDTRKDARREMIGIMPVVTTAANAMYAQRLIDVDRENVIGYETVGQIRTLDASKDLELAKAFPAVSALTPNAVLSGDLARTLNTADWYRYVAKVDVRVTNDGTGARGLARIPYGESEAAAKDAVSSHLAALAGYVKNSWDGGVQEHVDGDVSYAAFSY